MFLFAGLLGSPSLFAVEIPPSQNQDQRLEALSHTQSWLKVYHYKTHTGFTSKASYRSDITVDRFFFSRDGKTNPTAEMKSAIEAYSHPERKVGTQNDSAACVFPYRKIVLERLLGQSFPDVNCTELTHWVHSINADAINLVFVGAYPGNPASLLGHSFLRFVNTDRARENREGNDLLSYSVGFAALPDPRDGRIAYMLKGLTGGYSGSFEIEPHYMKVGLYNNSESRDLWEIPLTLDASEVHNLVLHFWELTFNSLIDYYFIDENCSYHLLKLIEAIRPNADLTSNFGIVVLPSETLRAAIDAGVASPHFHFRPSVKRRREAKIDLLSKEQRAQFKEARNSVQATQAITDATTIDALLDHWLYTNYRAHTDLSEEQRELMEATYKQAAIIQTNSHYIGVPDRLPPFLGHRPSWWTASLGATRTAALGQFQYRNGAHPLWSSDQGYDDLSAIEYLGFDIRASQDALTRWTALLAKVDSFENILASEPKGSWVVEAKASNDCLLCRVDDPAAQVSAGYGAALSIQRSRLYLLGDVRVASWLRDGAQALSAPGWRLGTKIALEKESLTFLGELGQHVWRTDVLSELSVSATLQRNVDDALITEFRYSNLRQVSDSAGLTFGMAHFF